MKEDLFVSLSLSNTEGIVIFCNAGSGKVETSGTCSWEDLDTEASHSPDPSTLLETRWAALTSLAKSLYQNWGSGKSSIRGLSFSSPQGVLVFLDDSGKVLSLLPEDKPGPGNISGKGNLRGASPRTLPPSTLYPRTLSSNTLFEGDLVTLRLKKIKSENPTLLKKASALLFLSDWMGYKLSGQLYLDALQLGTSALFDSSTSSLNCAELEKLGIPAGLISQTRLPGDKPLTLTEGAAEELGFPEDTPLVWGGGDSSLASFAEEFSACLGSPFSRMIAIGTLQKERFFRQLLSSLPSGTSFSGKPGLPTGYGALLCAASVSDSKDDPEYGKSQQQVFPERNSCSAAEIPPLFQSNRRLKTNWTREDPVDVRETLLEVNRSLFKKGWITYTGGNISVRSRENPEEIWITPGGINKEKLNSDSLVQMDLSGRLLSQGPYKPSSEYRVHTEIFLRRKDIQAIIHTHTPYATLMGLTDTEWLPISAEGELFGTLPVVPFLKPGTQELSLKVAEAIGSAGCCVLMENHGLIVAAGDLWKAAELTEILELQAFKLITCRMMGIIPKTLQPF